MSALDIIVLALIGGGAVFGFLRGFVQEVLALGAWVAAIVAIRFGLEPAAAYLLEPIGSEGGATVLAFLLLFAVTYGVGKFIARRIGRSSRASVLGPIDRVLGFGFGAIKGLIVATLAFLLFILVYETIWPGDAKPEWMTESRTYPLLGASGAALSDFVAERRAEAE